LRKADGSFINFDPAGSTYTYPAGINSEGDVTGDYGHAANLTHGFIRRHSGEIKSFDPPGSLYTYPNAINGSGEVTGQACDTSVCNGFVRLNNED